MFHLSVFSYSRKFPTQTCLFIPRFFYEKSNFVCIKFFGSFGEQQYVLNILSSSQLNFVWFLVLVCIFYVFNFRISLTCACPMHLALFPLDEQICNLDIASCKFYLINCFPVRAMRTFKPSKDCISIKFWTFYMKTM